MHRIAQWSVENRVAVNLIMLFIIIAGLFTVANMRREMFPQFDLDMVYISVKYPGANPEEVEEGICIKIEEKVKSIEGIKKLHSIAYEGLGEVIAEVESDFDVQEILDDIKTEIDGIDNFPEQAEDPSIISVVQDKPAVTVALYGDVSEKLLRRTAEKVRDDLADFEEISLVSLVGVRNYEISVEISEQNLRKYGLTFDDVVSALKSGSIDLPGGAIKTSHGEILIRSKGQAYTGTEISRIPLITLKDGTVVTVGEVANVIDGFEDADKKTRFNGKPAALVRINSTSSEDVIRISDAVQDYVEKHRLNLPAGIESALWLDLSTVIRERIDLLLENGIQGIILVFVFLALFLNFRLSLWVSAGIPISFMGAFLFLNSMGQTINMLSLFAFIMTLGILVDDAIIIGENIYTHHSMGKEPLKAVTEGFREVGFPILIAISTTITAFVPLLYIGGIIGKFMAVMPIAVITILGVSLFEAFIILPAHFNHALTKTAESKKKESFHTKLRDKVELSLQRFIENIYTPALKYVIKNRYFTLVVGIAVLIISIGIVAGGYVSFVFFQKNESNWIIAELSHPLGTPIESTEKTIQYLEDKAFELNRTFKDKVENDKALIVNISSIAGVISRKDWKRPVYGGHCGEIWLELASSIDRPELHITEILNKWRSSMGDIPGVESLTFTIVGGGPGGNPIEVKIIGDDFKILRAVADELKAEIKTYPGTFDVADNFKAGKEEKQARVKPGAKSIGISMADIARQIRQAFYGEEALRIQRGKDDVKVMVRYAEKDRKSLAGIEEMLIRTLDGREIPIREVAEITDGRAYSVITRVDRKRVVTVTSDIDEAAANARKIAASLKSEFFPKLLKRYPGIKCEFGGQEKRTEDSLNDIKRGFSLALMVIFLLLAAQFRSYIQPVIIMMAIPFGLIGAVAGHLIMGRALTMLSIFGIVALSGIVVNDSLILIDFINKARRSGKDTDEAVFESGRARFRPVLLTSITTVAGLFPLLLERSFQAQFLIPMAISISFGLIAATFLTLLYVPALYLIVKDATDKFLSLKTRFKQHL